MIEEHCYQPGDQVQVGEDVYRLDRLAVWKKQERWFGWREHDGKYMEVPAGMVYTGFSEIYLGGDEQCLGLVG